MTPKPDRRMQHFLLLDRTEQEQAIRRLIASGMSEATAASVSGLSIEQVRRIMAEQNTQKASA